jgi:hypothetical protein
MSDNDLQPIGGREPIQPTGSYVVLVTEPSTGVSGAATLTSVIGLLSDQGSIKLNVINGTHVTIKPNVSNAASYDFTLPINTGTAGQVLQTDGTGATSWVSPSSGIPQGDNLTVQYNNNGDFAGSIYLTVDGASGWPGTNGDTSNTGFGYGCFANLNSSEYNTAFGFNACGGGGGNNTALGCNAMAFAGETAAFNTAVGALVLLSVSEGENNVAVGAATMEYVTTGSDNIGIGWQALSGLVSGDGNTAVGSESLRFSLNSGNVACGYKAGSYSAADAQISDSANSVYIGSNARAAAADSNTVVIGYNAASGGANTITLGNSSITTLRCQVTSITGLSDARDKTNIAPLPTAVEFVNALKPVKFTWNMRDGQKVGVDDYGFLAQDLQQAQAEYDFDWAKLVNESDPERLEVAPGKLIPILVKALQELSQQVKELKSTQ